MAASPRNTILARLGPLSARADDIPLTDERRDMLARIASLRSLCDEAVSSRTMACSREALARIESDILRISHWVASRPEVLACASPAARARLLTLAAEAGRTVSDRVHGGTGR